MNSIIIKEQILSIINKTVRPLESRSLARRLAKRYNVTVFCVYGVISGLVRSSQVSIKSRKHGGPSYIR